MSTKTVETTRAIQTIELIHLKNVFLTRLYDVKGQHLAEDEIMVSDEEFAEWMQDPEFRARVDTFRRWQLHEMELRMNNILHNESSGETPAECNASIQAANILLRLWKPELFLGRKKSDITVNTMGAAQIIYTLKEGNGHHNP